MDDNFNNQKSREMNTTIKLAMTGFDNLKVAMQLTGQIFKRVEAYKVKDNTMILYWSDKGKNVQKLPYPMTPDQAAQFVWGWLENTPPDYSEPDTEAQAKRGNYMLGVGGYWMMNSMLISRSDRFGLSMVND